MRDKRNVVLGLIGADAHIVGNRILDYALTNAGFKVINLGIFNTQEDFIKSAIETNSAAILVGSLYGQGELDCQGFRAKCEEVGLKDIILYAGGNLVIGKQDWHEVESRFKAMGFDRVYAPGSLPAPIIADLKTDLGIN